MGMNRKKIAILESCTLNVILKEKESWNIDGINGYIVEIFRVGF